MDIAASLSKACPSGGETACETTATVRKADSMVRKADSTVRKTDRAARGALVETNEQEIAQNAQVG